MTFSHATNCCFRSIGITANPSVYWSVIGWKGRNLLFKVSLPGDTYIEISVANIRGSFRSASIPSKGCKKNLLLNFLVGLSGPGREKISAPSGGMAEPTSFWLTLQCSTTKPQITPLLVKSFTILKQRKLFGAKL